MVPEPHTICRQLVHVRRDDLFVAITTHRPDRLVIRKEEDDVRTRVGSMQRRQRREQQSGEKGEGGFHSFLILLECKASSFRPYSRVGG